ncbi:RNA polymerase sigma factor [Thermoanaerobacterium thermosaccharolyticum]|uniref:RNA polymerase sigma factor n=1 Tax=Thermoanaerobacterium thermosaccharolyticum TaxID=1517 RepID=UPI003DA9EA28
MLILFDTITDEGQRKKIEDMYVKYSRDMFKVAYNILNDYQLAQDAVQSAFINIINYIEKISDYDCNKIRALVVIIVRNISINMYNKIKRQKNLFIEDADEFFHDDSEPFDEKIINGDIFNRVSEKVKELKTEYADIISLKYYYGYSDKDIANLLNITQNNVRVRLHRARQSLKNALYEYKGDVEI